MIQLSLETPQPRRKRAKFVPPPPPLRCKGRGCTYETYWRGFLKDGYCPACHADWMQRQFRGVWR